MIRFPSLYRKTKPSLSGFSNVSSKIIPTSLKKSTLKYVPIAIREYSTQGQKFKKSDLIVQTIKTPSQRQPNSELVFGKYFTDHILEADWSTSEGWGKPIISPYHKFEIEPSASVLHYAIECFEGMKSYLDKDGKIRLFRPMDNLRRFNSSCRRLALPEVDEIETLECMKEFLKMEKEFIPQERGYSLYLRPTMISTSPSLGVHVSRSAKFFVIASPVGPYYKTGFKPVSLYADDVNIRAWPGGTGSHKLGANYAPTILPALEASNKGYSQVLWLMDGLLSEVGTMNFFLFWVNEQGEKELITPPLDGIILPGITRASVLDLAREWNEFKVSERNVHITELIKAVQEGRVIESFGSGTAAVISPIENIHYKGVDYRIPLGTKGSKLIGELSERFMNTIMSIQYGDIPSQWSVIVD